MDVTVRVSPSFRFSPVGLDDDGAGLCVELVLPIVCPEESCPEEGLDAPPAFSAKDSVVVPAKRAIATAATAILCGNCDFAVHFTLLKFCGCSKQRADKLQVRYADEFSGIFCSHQ